MFSKIFFNILILICEFNRNAVSQNTVDLNFENAVLTQNGLGWPSHLEVVKGNVALMKLRVTLANLRSCTVTGPSGIQFDVKQPPNNRYQQWGDGCGVRVIKVEDIDEGRWRLYASRLNDSFVGWIDLNVLVSHIIPHYFEGGWDGWIDPEMFNLQDVLVSHIIPHYFEGGWDGWIDPEMFNLQDVLEKTPPKEAPPISLQDGETHVKVALSSIDNAYCVVAKPFAESSLVPGQCSVTLDRTTRAVQGNWQVFLGVPGTVAEVQTKRHVVVQTERLDVGYVHDAAGKLHLYCNILHSNKEITFCRFQRTSNTYGYNVIDGLSDGSYSYYGDGFIHKQCGITIEKPSEIDYSTWRCSVGVGVREGNVMHQQTPMQALISVTQSSKSLHNDERSEDASRKIFVQKDSPFSITCNAGLSLRYCWFQHPNGTQFTPVIRTNEQQLFWYTGESLEVGMCGITFAHSNDSDDGIWSCFMGPRAHTGVEIKDQVEVRVTGPLAANLKDVLVTLGENTTLYCHTSNGRRALNYCRFLSPQFVGMSLDSTVTPENAILDRFYFTSGRDLNSGDCSLSITSVHEEDIGTWTCAAVVDNEILESRDTVRVFVDGTRRHPRLQAGIIGTSAGLLVLIVMFIGYVSYKRGWMQNLLSLRLRSNTVVSEDYALQTSVASESRCSDASGSTSSDASGSIRSAASRSVSSDEGGSVTVFNAERPVVGV